MTVRLARQRLQGLPGTTSVATSHFGFLGEMTANEILTAIAGRRDDDHVNLRGPIDKPTIEVCRKNELPNRAGIDAGGSPGEVFSSVATVSMF
jgi:hypothetical protein